LISVSSEDKFRTLRVLGLPNVFTKLEQIKFESENSWNISLSPYVNEQLYLGQRPGKLGYIASNKLKKTFREKGLVLVLFRLNKIL